MSTVTLDQALDLAMQLPTEQQEMLLEILKRRQSEHNRREMANDAKTSLNEFRSGYFVAQNADTVISELHRLLDQP